MSQKALTTYDFIEEIEEEVASYVDSLRKEYNTIFDLADRETEEDIRERLLGYIEDAKKEHEECEDKSHDYTSHIYPIYVNSIFDDKFREESKVYLSTESLDICVKLEMAKAKRLRRIPGNERFRMIERKLDKAREEFIKNANIGIVSEIIETRKMSEEEKLQAERLRGKLPVYDPNTYEYKDLGQFLKDNHFLKKYGLFAGGTTALMSSLPLIAATIANAPAKEAIVDAMATGTFGILGSILSFIPLTVSYVAINKIEYAIVNKIKHSRNEEECRNLIEALKILSEKDADYKSLLIDVKQQLENLGIETSLFEGKGM